VLLLERGLDCLPAGLTFGERNCIGERHLDLLIGHGFVSLAVLARAGRESGGGGGHGEHADDDDPPGLHV